MSLIDLDHNATTAPAPEVVEAVTRALRDLPGNPSSSHAAGRAARRAVEAAREQVAGLIGARADEILFTSGGTEADNLAVIGGARARVAAGAARHVITTAVEHPAVSQACSVLEAGGYRVSLAGVDASGRVSASEVSEGLREETALVSVMHANNETGALQPVAAIAEACRRRRVPLHTDAAQSLGKIPVSVDDLGADLLTVAGHKLYGPKGTGALYVRRGTPLEPFLVGATHERGLRPGTENVAGIVGLGVACELAGSELAAREARMRELRDRLEAHLRERIPDLVRHGPATERLPNTLYVSIPGADAGALLAELAEEVAASPGAACHAGKVVKPSAVLSAMGVSPELARCALRLSLGRESTAGQIDHAAERIAAAAARLRAGSTPPAPV